MRRKLVGGSKAFLKRLVCLALAVIMLLSGTLMVHAVTCKDGHRSGRKIDSYSSYTSSQHVHKRTCSKCGKVWKYKEKHWLSKTRYTKVSKTTHYKIVSCRCGYSKKTKQSHTFSKGRCTKCGYRK